MTTRSTVVIADDEPIARRGVRQVLAERANLDVVAECRNGVETVEAIRVHQPDLVVLDIQMPGLDGFDVIRKIGVKEMPCVVFLTAFNEHALDAFAVAATDYVVKPYSPERLLAAIDRAVTRIRERRVTVAHERLLAALGSPASDGVGSVATPYASRILVSVGTRSIVVPLDTVQLIEADGNYLRVHTATARYIVRESFKELEPCLDPREFVRVHRSAIVRISAVRALERVDHERLVAVLADGARIMVSRGRRDSVIAVLGSIRG